MPHNGKLYIETVGCQMNVLDSELVVAALRQQGYALTDDMKEADTVLFNTCSVREHAEQKIYSQLGRLRVARKKKPDQVIGVIGCMAQKDQELIFQKAPHVDLIVGTGQLAEIPRLIDEARRDRKPAIAVSLDRKEGSRLDVASSFESYDPLRDPEMRPSPWQAYVRIMFGCDKFCTYCVVPMTRGPEQSRAPSEIIREVQSLVAQGVREVTLLGQTVNSYKFTENGRQSRMSDLLAAIHDTPGLQRIKFVTNFPKDMTDDLLQAIRDLPKVSRYLHVPLQHGCDEVLKRMKRGYTVADYRDMMARIRETVPGAAVSSDFIVGFCGETEEAFQKCMDVVREFRFKNSFIFKYSPRPGTKANELWSDDIPEEVKRRRNNELLTLQNEISEEDNAEFLGRTVEVLVEGPSKRTTKAKGTTSGQMAEDANLNYPMPGVVESAVLAGHVHRDHDHDHDDAGCDTGCGTGALVSLDLGRSGSTVAAAASRTEPVQLVGRTPCDRIVVFDGQPRLAGSIAEIHIHDCTPTTLLGSIVTRQIQHGNETLLPILM
ncbi:tRNA (N6-isopentenyl adenosine(37)-C2)-methylthiotransferase MiaB [Planctomyces sp. SH-PL14]|uniref:tRNA (N6-isopentenyl adenosine(37)-C2)-methylthiotransferase MiaB n=1 Tax=Planctomyces sp. SH-PL14 TaxID=1632864 RepID=UPI00078E7736|nr:tRNA (N6-isopentenyl adenosine(37)-C2)-methylthiotransferase MiaB [Planctomyces sp. SH-PL14]AMV22263.1 (Dimethylallyl)adenosine tRNA methylthiotransferase MiaB [Planctomyces sp. SH-PL14]